MTCVVWLVCGACGRRLEVGQWQGLVEVPRVGRCWVHEACVVALGHPPRDRELYPDRDSAASVEPGPAPAVRIVVIGHPDWPYARAVEVRDALDAVARGHRRVVLIHPGRTDPATGQDEPLGAWVELTARRRGHDLEHQPISTAAEVAALGADVVVAFPLDEDPATIRTVDELEALGVPVLVHRASEPSAAAGEPAGGAR